MKKTLYKVYVETYDNKRVRKLFKKIDLEYKTFTWKEVYSDNKLNAASKTLWLFPDVKQVLRVEEL